MKKLASNLLLPAFDSLLNHCFLGDFYLTRHSNLSQVHVVCHLVVEERSILDSNLRARDTAMQGLRSSLRIIAKQGIRHITIPLFLTGRMKPVYCILVIITVCEGECVFILSVGYDNKLVFKKSRTSFQICQRLLL